MAAINQEELLGTLIPDAYIKRITLENGGSPIVENNPHIDHERERLPPKSEKDADTLNVTLDIILKEKLNNDLIGTWFGQQDIGKYLKVNIFQVTDPETTAIFSAGSDMWRLADKKRAVLPSDLKVKLAAQVYQVNKASTVYDRLNKAVTSQIISVKKDVEGNDSSLAQFKSTTDDDGNKVFDITYRATFQVKTSNPAHLAYFVVSYLDLEEMAQDYDLDLDGLGLQQINGKVASDVVIDDFTVVSRSYVFYDPSNKIWSGLVHRLPNGQWRTGRREQEDSINLRRDVVYNTKVQDFRDVKEIERLVINFSAVQNEIFNKNPIRRLTNDNMEPDKKRKYFSEMYLARDRDGDAKFAFSIDFAKMLEEQSVYGPLLKRKLPRLRREMAARTNIRQMKVYRQRVKQDLKGTRLGMKGLREFDKNEPLEFVVSSGEKTYKKFTKINSNVAALREVNVVMEEETPGLRHFTGMDKTMSEVTDGLYRYVVEVEVDDASHLYLKEKLAALLQARQSLTAYLNETSQPSTSKYLAEVRDPHIDHPSEFAGTEGRLAGNYDPVSNRFTQHFIDTVRRRYGRRRLSKGAPWIAPVLVYLDTLDIFTGILQSREAKTRLIKTLSSYVAPETGNPRGIMTVLSLVDNLATTIYQILGVTIDMSLRTIASKDTTSSQRQSTIQVGGRTRIKSFNLKHEFEEIFDSDIVKNQGLDYLSLGIDDTQNYDGLRILDPTSYERRADRETLRFFKDRFPDVNLVKSGKTIVGNDSIRTSRFSYLSPSRIDFRKKSIVLSDEPIKQQDTSAKSKVTRYVQSAAAGSVGIQDTLVEARAMMLLENSSKTPRASAINNDVNTKKKKSDPLRDSEEVVKKSFSSLFAEKYNVTVRPIKVESVKDSDGDTVLEPVIPEELSSFVKEPLTDRTVENKIDAQSTDISDSDSRVGLNTFFQVMAMPAIQTGITNYSLTDNVFETKLTSPSDADERDGFSDSVDISQLATNIQAEVSTQGDKVITGLKGVVTDTQMRDLPNQIKAVFLQNSDKNVVNSDKLRILTKTSDRTEEKVKNDAEKAFTFEMLVGVEYLAGYRKNEAGDPMLGSPVWKKLTEEVNNQLAGEAILCRLKPYSNDKLGIRENKGLKSGIYDLHFILIPKRVEIEQGVANVGTVDATDGVVVSAGGLLPRVQDVVQANIPNVVFTPVKPVLASTTDTASGRDLVASSALIFPVTIDIVQINSDGSKTSIKGSLATVDFQNPNNPSVDDVKLGVNVGNIGEIVGVNVGLATSMLAADCQNEDVPAEFAGTISATTMTVAEAAQEMEIEIFDVVLPTDPVCKECPDGYVAVFEPETNTRICVPEQQEEPVVNQVDATPQTVAQPDSPTSSGGITGAGALLSGGGISTVNRRRRR